MSEIEKVAKSNLEVAAEGAVLFLEKLSPAIREVDSSSGALGNATYGVVQTLVPIIAQAEVGSAVRQRWLERLFAAMQEDDPPYLESLGDSWGELCADAALASQWADEFLLIVRRIYQDRKKGQFGFFCGTGACYSALFKAGRHDEILELLEQHPKSIWQESVWGARVWAARGETDKAITYAKSRAGLNVSVHAVAQFAEQVLLEAGRREAAYREYAIQATPANTYLAQYRALAKKYPDISPEKLLQDLMATTPLAEGKWFATAKTLKLYDQAKTLAWRSPVEPKTLIRAARDHVKSRADFAAQAALVALHWIQRGHGHEISGLEVREAWMLAMEAGANAGQLEVIKLSMMNILNEPGPAAKWIRAQIGV